VIVGHSPYRISPAPGTCYSRRMDGSRAVLVGVDRETGSGILRWQNGAAETFVTLSPDAWTCTVACMMDVQLSQELWQAMADNAVAAGG
jgi:hypothetical protein